MRVNKDLQYGWFHYDRETRSARINPTKKASLLK